MRVVLIFYFAGEPIFFMLLIFSSLIDYTHSRTIERHRGTGKAKRVLVRSLILNLGLLIVFKYGNFIVDNINVFVFNRHCDSDDTASNRY